MGIRFSRRARVAAVSALSVVALGLTSCSGSGDLAGDADVNTIDASIAGSIEAAVQSAMELSGSTSAVVGVWQSDESAYVQGFGGVEAGAPIRAAQASQPVMCAMLLDLVDQGRLSLDRKISKDMPRQVGVEDITYGQLCDGKSGLADFKTSISDIFANNPTRPWSDRELTAQGLARSPLSWPGLDVHISDTDPMMLGRSLRLALGGSLPELLEEHVFSQAGMHSSYYPENTFTDMTLPSGGMTGYTYPISGGAPVCDAGVVEVPKVSPSMLAGAGATVTTVTDLKNFYEHYLGGGFGEGTKDLVTATVTNDNPQRDENGDPLPPEEGAEPASGARLWGFGLEQVGPLFGMSGSITGTITAAYHDPASGLSVVVSLNNSTAGAGFARTLAFELAALAGGEVSWTAEDQAAALAAMAVCPVAEEEAPAEG